MDFKQTFLNRILNASDDEKEKIFKELCDEALNDNKKAVELLEFLANYDDVAIRYFAKKSLDFILTHKNSDISDDFLDVSDILKQLKDKSEDISYNDNSDFKPINIDALIKYLKVSDYKKRIKVIQGAAKMRDPEAIPHLLKALSEEKHPFVKATLVKALGTFNDASVIPIIADYLKDPDPRIRANAIEGLEQIRDKRIIEYIIPLLKDPEHRVRANAAKVLVKYGHRDVMDVLEKMIESPAIWQIESAIYALGEIGNAEAYEILKRKFFKSQNEDIKIAIIRAIDNMNMPDKVLFFREVLNEIRDKDSKLYLIIKGLIEDGKETKEISIPVNRYKNNWIKILSMGVILFIIIISGFIFFNKIKENKNKGKISNASNDIVFNKTEDDSDNFVTDELKIDNKKIDKDFSNNVSEKQVTIIDNKRNDLLKDENEKDFEDKIVSNIDNSKVLDENTSIKKLDNDESEIEESGIINDINENIFEVDNEKENEKEEVKTDDKEKKEDKENVINKVDKLKNNIFTNKKIDNTKKEKEDVAVISTIIDWDRKRITKEVNKNIDDVKPESKKSLSFDERLKMLGIDAKTRKKVLALVKKEKKRLNPKILILYLKSDSISKNLKIYSKGITDFLINNFKKIPGIEVISRNELQDRMLALGLNINDLDNIDVAQEFGDYFGVDYVIFGNFREIGSKFDVYFERFVKEVEQINQDNIGIQGKLPEDMLDDIQTIVAQVIEDTDELEDKSYEIARDILEGRFDSEWRDMISDVVKERILERIFLEAKNDYENGNIKSAESKFLFLSNLSNNREISEYLRSIDYIVLRDYELEKKKMKQDIMIKYNFKILDVNKRKKLLWKGDFVKSLDDFPNILKIIFDKLCKVFEFKRVLLKKLSIFNGFTNNLEAFLRLYWAVDLIDIDVGDRVYENYVDDALNIIKYTIDMDKNFAGAYYYASQLYVRKGDIQKALDMAVKASLLDPIDIRIKYQIVQYRKKLGDINGAKLVLEEISKIKNVEYKNILLRSHLDLAYKYFNDGNRQKAAKEIQKALLVDVKNGEAFLAMGLYYYMKKQWKKSYYALEEADKLYKNSIYVKLLLARVLYVLEDYDNMIEVLKKAQLGINKDKRFFDGKKFVFKHFKGAPGFNVNSIYYYLGLAFKQKGSYGMAKTYFRQCIEMDRYNNFAYKARRELGLLD